MNRRLRFLCTILMCGALFVSECMKISVFASAADSGEICEEEIGNEAAEEEQEIEDEEQNEDASAEIIDEAQEITLPEEIEDEMQEEVTPEEIEDETEKEEPEDGESITITFDASYGSGTYMISEEDGEWLTAEGDVEVELPEDGSVTMQIKADEGCFIVSDQGEGMMSEMQIEASLDNKEEFEDFTVSFETGVTGSVELGISGGVLGNEFAAKIHIEENINTEDLYCEWIYEWRLMMFYITHFH